MTLNNVTFYQFLHTLHGDRGVYDERDYGGGWPAYRYGITLQGDSHAFDLRDYSTKLVTDTVAMKFSMPPSGYELGAYGMKNAGDHQFGKPATGTHLSVESNSLNGSDFFDPDESDPDQDAWVSGAVSFNLGSFADQEEKSLDVLLAVKSSHVDAYPPIKLKVHHAGMINGLYTIQFEETTMNPLVGFVLRKSSLLDMPVKDWEFLPVGYQLDVPMPNWRTFEFAVDTESEPSAFFSVVPRLSIGF
ncbi:MAG: hypothetical protein ACQCXQ_04925 [Verrucomicrobiales bacterium]|nr:hypothetical protein [Verrucomicrobiota bacterium JB025]